MKKLLYLIFPIVLLGCDDGDIITNDFDFEDTAVEACSPTISSGIINNYVFYKNENTNFESLVLQFTTSDDVLNLIGRYGPYNVNDSGTSFEYRKFNAAPGSGYYCNNIPPSTPRVTDVFTAIGGQIFVETGIRSDDDNDGIPSSEEGIVFDENGAIDDSQSQDSDSDGIPDYLDFDDDGDNVPTRLEGVVLNTDNTINLIDSRNTDGNGNLDYLDNDDDGDGALTINEDLDRNLDPTNDTNTGQDLPNYLTFNATPEQATPLINEYREHTINRILQLRISVELLTLQNNQEEIVFDTTYPFGDFIKQAVELTCTPDFPGTTGSGECIFQ